MSSPPIDRVILAYHQLQGKELDLIHLLSGMTMPSSTQEILVFTAPISITHAFEIPDPKVAHIDSCLHMSR